MSEIEGVLWEGDVPGVGLVQLLHAERGRVFIDGGDEDNDPQQTWRSTCVHLARQLAAAREELAATSERLRVVSEALKTYGGHDHRCASKVGPCDCGLRDALALARGGEG